MSSPGTMKIWMNQVIFFKIFDKLIKDHLLKHFRQDRQECHRSITLRKQCICSESLHQWNNLGMLPQTWESIANDG